MKRLLRPFSFGLFVLSVPISYVAFVFGLVVLLMLVERTFFDISDGLFYFSILYGLGCYLWIPGTWLLLSIGGRFLLKRRARSPEQE